MIGRASRARMKMMAGGAFRRSAGFVAFACLMPWLLPAQAVRSSVVLGGVRVRYADALDVSALTLSPALALQSGLDLLAVSGTVSQPTVGPWTGQGMLSGSRFRPLRGRLAAELGASAGGSTAGDGTHTGNTNAVVRAHLTAARAGAWAGAGAGLAWNGIAWKGTRVAELGAWLQGDATSVVASWSPVVANDSVRYRDAVIALRWRAARLELDGTLGHRARGTGATGFVDPSDWASVSASWRHSDRAALVASGGTYPLDLLQGYPAGRFVSLGLRLTGPGSGPSPEFARGASELERDRLVRGGISTFRARRAGDGRYELRLRASGANEIEITGDLTGWEPVAMHAEPDGWWSLLVDAEPGTTEITVRRDHGAWLVPAGLVERRDELGGVAGVLTLP